MAYTLNNIIIDNDTEWCWVPVVNNNNQDPQWKSLFSIYVENIEETDIIELIGQFVATNNQRPNMFLASKVFAVPATLTLPTGYTTHAHITPNINSSVDAELIGGEWDGTSKNVSSDRHHETETTIATFSGLEGSYYFNLCAWGMDGTLSGLNTSYFDVQMGNGNMVCKHYKLS